MTKKIVLGLGALIVVLVVLFFVYPSPTTPQEPYVIGVLHYLPIFEPSEQGLKARLADLGYEEGEDVVYDVRHAYADFDALDQHARELIEKNVDLIYATALEGALSAQKEVKARNRSDIPIVFVNANNPDELGLIDSFQSPGGNITGVATDFANVTAKKLEFFKQINPTIKKIGVFNAKVTDPAGKYMLANLRELVGEFGMQLVEYPLQQNPGPAAVEEIQSVMATIKSGDIDAYYQLPGPILSIPDNIGYFIALPTRLKIPSVFLSESMVKGGGLMSYQHDFYGVGEQAGDYIDKIFKGVKPADIPVEFQKKTVLILNKKVADGLGITFPQSMVSIADRVIQ